MGDDPGHVPHPFRQFILKVHSRCDLACDYCFVYTKEDQRWVDRPPTMTRSTIDAIGQRIAEHVRAHHLASVSVVLHGGEPLLAGIDRIAYYVETIRAVVDATVTVRFALQTNGVLLTPAGLAALRQLGVRVGVSLDGDRVANDRHRRRRDGRSSYSHVAAALHELARPENRDIYSGIICAVDLANDPVATYEALIQYSPPLIDFLLPLGNWTNPPPGRLENLPATPYSDWLIAVFDRWYDAPFRETGVRYFEDVINVLLGGRATTVGVGLAPVAAIVVETDGAMEVCDGLTGTFLGAAVTDLSVADSTFDEALAVPLVIERQGGVRVLAPACQSCELLHVCGGGVHAQRYRVGNGFQNPSVYCPDLFALIAHIRGRLATDLAGLRSVSDSLL